MRSAAPSRFSRTGARRVAATAVAAAVLVSPLLAVAPAMAEPFAVSSVSFGQSTLDIGQNVSAYFNGDVATTEVQAEGLCMAEYKNGGVIQTFSVGSASATASFSNLTGSYRSEERRVGKECPV